MTGWNLLIDRDDLRHTTVVDAPSPDLSAGDVRLKVDSFGLTANNVTYGAAGDMLGYWTFFPAPDTGDDVNWGRVPVWGFADVVESLSDEVAVGERLFGYLPMSSELIIRPTESRPGMVTDGSEHRAALSAVYNEFYRCADDPLYSPQREDAQMVLRILFITSFMIDDLLDDNGFFGSSTVIMTSASSKTAFGTAFMLKQRSGIEVVGLTSPGNVEFVEGLGCYDRVVTYDEIGSLPVGKAVLLDFSGNANVVRSVHEHFADELTYSSIIGVTHWEDRIGSMDPLPGPAQAFFFVPTEIDRRRGDWGPGGLEDRLGVVWPPFTESAADWVAMQHGNGSDAIAAVWAELVEGSTSPDTAHVLHP